MKLERVPAPRVCLIAGLDFLGFPEFELSVYVLSGILFTAAQLWMGGAWS